MQIVNESTCGKVFSCGGFVSISIAFMLLTEWKSKLNAMFFIFVLFPRKHAEDGRKKKNLNFAVLTTVLIYQYLSWFFPSLLPLAYSVENISGTFPVRKKKSILTNLGLNDFNLRDRIDRFKKRSR